MRQCCVPGCKNTSNLRKVPFTKVTWKAWLVRCPFLRKYSRKSLENVKICELHFLPQHVKSHRLTADAIPTLHLPKQNIATSSRNEQFLEVFPLQSGQPLSVRIVNPSVSLIDTVNVQTDFDYNKQSVFPPTNDQVPCVQSRDITERDFEPNNQSIVTPSTEQVQCVASQINKETTEPDFYVQSDSMTDSITTNVVHSCSTSTETQNQSTEPELTVGQLSPLPSNTMPSDVISAIQRTPVRVKSHSRRHKSHVKSDLIPRVRLGQNETPRKQKLRVGNEMLKMKLRNLTLRFNKLKSKTLSWSTQVKLFIKKYPLLSNFGFILRCTVSDQGSANVAAINSLIADTREDILRSGNDDPNIFHYMIDKNKLYHMYDVPHLLKCFRNNFQKKDLLIGTQRAQWNYIEMVYASDGAQGRARTTKLTDKHIKPNSYDKMKVKFAAQVFSREVFAALQNRMKTYEDLQLVHNYSVPSVNIDNGFFTAEIILFINDLFDSLNCAGHTRGELSNALSLNSTHLEFWNNALKKLQSMKFDATDSRESKPISLRNFIHDIKTVKHLWADLKKIEGVKFLSLKRLNQDPLENFFSQIRGQGGASTHPDCHNFVALFKTLLINNITTGQSLYANCTSDTDKMLGTLSSLIDRPKLGIQYNDFTTDVENLNFIENSIPHENIFQTQSASYIAGAICRHILPKLDCGECQNCKSTLLSNEIEPFHSLIATKEYDSSNKKLYYPSHELVVLVWHCIYIIEETLPKICKVFIYTDLVSKLECLDTSFMTCLEHKSDFLKAFWLYVIRMQVRQWCINFNRRIHNVDSRKKGKEMEDMLTTKVTKGASYRTARRQSH
ncbi:uncharacterized protein LOC123878308 isoform X2 [Maniola jurtina]|uniref:uncharacterized protein LOC123878308 isoform X2 n=1 Tax=Maniola jurtina TaxID=191418 RepID=UPI001E688AA1|nr:uncharacterized protein LOC123878308 isoform X2 [Maniola jurtina]